MTIRLFDDAEQLNVHALFLGQRLDLRAFEKGQRLASAPLAVTAGSGGCAVLFRYGVAVLFGLDDDEVAGFVRDIHSFVIEPFAEPVSEELLLQQGDGREGLFRDHLRLNAFSIERLQLVADVLAKSVVLDHYEQSVAASFDLIDPLAAEMQRAGHGGRQARVLLRHIGDTLSIQSKMVGRVEVSEKPELLWEHPELERLYLRLEDEYELSERHIALERKLELISRTAETLLSLLQDRRSHHAEWYIVILIVIAILLSLYKIYLGGH